MDLLASFLQHWQQKKFAAQGQSVLLAVSGGADSMALAHLLLKAGISFGMAHCNFGLRGEESDVDEAFVHAWAKQNNIPFYTTRFDTNAVAAAGKKGIQETARDLRYTWLEQVRAEHGYGCIATAHHANDNAETLLINLFKGTGIAGLHGIREQHGKIIRPLLFALREKIQQYAKENSIAFREDSSNASDKYLRNAVRLHIIPEVEKYFPGAAARLNESITRFAQAEQVYRTAMNRQLKKLKEQRGKDVYVPVLKLLKTEPLETVCYELFQPYGFTSAQVPHIAELAGAGSGKFMESERFRIVKDRDFLIITEKEATATDIILVESVPAKIDVGGQVFSFGNADADAPLPADTNIATLNADALQFPLVLRRWRTGDYFYPLGMGMKKKKLSRFFIDQKLPLHKKESVWVLESNKRIVWVAGMRIDERFKIKPGTSQIMQITMSARTAG